MRENVNGLVAGVRSKTALNGPVQLVIVPPEGVELSEYQLVRLRISQRVSTWIDGLAGDPSFQRHISSTREAENPFPSSHLYCMVVLLSRIPTTNLRLALLDTRSTSPRPKEEVP